MGDEIRELRRRGVEVVACSVLRPVEPTSDKCGFQAGYDFQENDALYLTPLSPWCAIAATWLWIQQFWKMRRLWLRVVSGAEPLSRKVKTLLHTWLGTCMALRLRGQGIEHIHVHHGYFASWVAMIAARLLGIRFSVTLHGSDLLLHEAYLDLKLAECAFAVTISKFNRNHVLDHYPQIDPAKILVQHMGVDCDGFAYSVPSHERRSHMSLLAVGRLQPVKNHAFLIQACRLLKDRGAKFCCAIAGDGPERNRLETLVDALNLKSEVYLLGHVRHDDLDALYAQAELVVLTSKSEGIPLVLMEAMARARPVLAPAITGIPELVTDGANGFLYRPGSLSNFVERIEMIRDTYSVLGPLCQAARQQVRGHFDGKRNLAAFCDELLLRIGQNEVKQACEDSLLQQI